MFVCEEDKGRERERKTKSEGEADLACEKRRVHKQGLYDVTVPEGRQCAADVGWDVRSWKPPQGRQ